MTDAVFTDENGDRIFPFFDLKAELRLMVYDVLRNEDFQELEKRKGCIALYVKNAPLTNVQLVCRQMRHEYLHQNARHCMAAFCDHKDNEFKEGVGYGLPWAKSIAKVSRFRNVDFRVFIKCESCPEKPENCRADAYVSRTNNVANGILGRMTGVVSLRVVFGLSWKATEKETFPNLLHGNALGPALYTLFEQLRPFKLDRMDIVAVDGCYPEAATTLEDECRPFVYCA